MADSLIGEQKGLYANVTTILKTIREGTDYAIMQARDDVQGNPIQFPGGWSKETDKSLLHTARRELIEEFGINQETGFYLPFQRPEDSFFTHPTYKNKFFMVLTEFDIPYDTAIQLDEVKREGARIDILPFDESLLKSSLYGPDRIIAEKYLADEKTLRKHAFQVSLPALDDFPEEIRKDLEEKILFAF